MAEMQSNRNDDIFGRTDKQFGIPSIDSLALNYSKAQLQQMAQMGRIPPIYAVMAGMAQDRIQLNNSHAPETTVTQDTFGQQVTDSSGQGIADSSGAAVGAGEPVAPQSAADISKAYGGLMSIPRPGEKYNQDNFATGGIVAFQQGGAPWESLEKAPPRPKNYTPKYYPPLSGALQGLTESSSRALQNLTESPDMRIDPATGEAVSLGEYMRRQEPKPQIMSSPEPAVAPAPAVATPFAVVKAREKIGETQPAGPLSAMAQKAAPASDEFAQKGMDALKLPKRTPADTTGLVDTPESIAKNKEDLLYRTVGYTGAEMMAGKSPFALVNIGEALSKGFSAYAQQIGEHKKATKEDIKDLAAIKRGEAALAQGEYKISADILQNELTNKRALEVAAMQIEGNLKATNINRQGMSEQAAATREATQAYRAEEQFRKNQIAIANDMKDWEAQQASPQGMIENSKMSQKNPNYVADKRAAKMLELEKRYRVGPSAGGDKDPLGLR